MPLSIEPLSIDYSFAGARRSAGDTIDADQLDIVFGVIAAKINELITALDVTTRDDDTLADACVEARNLADDTLEEISALINAKVTPP